VQIEQAIFTSARTEHAVGYQLVARSPGVTSDQARELAVWGPSHDALYSQGEEQSSVNFHRLTCGTYCVSKTVASGQEYSSRGGARIYTQFLLMPATVLARFANNPFAILRAASAKGMLLVHEHPPGILESFTLAGRTPAVDDGLLAQLADQLGPERVSRLVSAALSPGIKLLSGANNYAILFGGLLNYFPVECRTELTFTTGLRYSPRRPYQLASLIGDAGERRRGARYEGVTVVDLESTDSDVEGVQVGWAAYVADAIRNDQLPRLSTNLQLPRPGLCLADLSQLGEQLLCAQRGERVVAVPRPEHEGIRPSAAQPRAGSQRMFRTDRPTAQNSGDSDPRNISTKESTPLASSKRPSSFAFAMSSPTEAIDDPAALALLMQLDSVLCDAMNGSSTAVEDAGRVWNQICAAFEPVALSAVREQYLRYALSLWHACGDSTRQSRCAVQVLDLLEVLFEAE